MTITYRVITDYPVATNSPDHLTPFGTARDSSTCPEFNKKLFALVPNPVVLDLGCAGGGFVQSVIADGGEAVGIEGSDYSLKRKRAAWATCPGNLFTADITRPFTIEADGAPATFNVITAWEVMEHICEEDLAAVFDNIRRHLADGGCLMMSINTTPSENEGVALHQSVKPRRWWLDRFLEEGYAVDLVEAEHFGIDWMRMDCWANSLYAVWRAQ